MAQIRYGVSLGDEDNNITVPTYLLLYRERKYFQDNIFLCSHSCCVSIRAKKKNIFHIFLAISQLHLLYTESIQVLLHFEQTESWQSDGHISHGWKGTILLWSFTWSEAPISSLVALLQIISQEWEVSEYSSPSLLY